MTRRQFKGSFLIVEGDKDQLLLKNYVDRAGCKIRSGGSKGNAIETLAILEADGFAGVLGIVDADFDRLDGKVTASDNLLRTDHHDIEVMMFASAALDKVLGEFGSTEKIEEFERLRQTNIRGALIEAGRKVGYLRWLSLRQDLGLVFEGISYKKFVDSFLEVDVLKLAKTAKDHSQKPRLDESALVQQMSNLASPPHDALHVCCGHDLSGILSFALRKILGTNNKNDVTEEVIERGLRLAFDLSLFSQTELFQSIRGWERRNPPFRVLSE
jgi:hypothetical protein